MACEPVPDQTPGEGEATLKQRICCLEARAAYLECLLACPHNSPQCCTSCEATYSAAVATCLETPDE